MAYSFYSYAHNQTPNNRVMIALCPASTMSLGLDNASVLVGLLGWLLIGLMNAIRYAIPGFIIGVLAAVVCPRRLLVLPKK